MADLTRHQHVGWVRANDAGDVIFRPNEVQIPAVGWVPVFTEAEHHALPLMHASGSGGGAPRERCTACGGTAGTYSDEPTVSWWTCHRCGNEQEVDRGDG